MILDFTFKNHIHTEFLCITLLSSPVCLLAFFFCSTLFFSIASFFFFSVFFILAILSFVEEQGVRFPMKKLGVFLPISGSQQQIDKLEIVFEETDENGEENDGVEDVFDGEDAITYVDVQVKGKPCWLGADFGERSLVSIAKIRLFIPSEERKDDYYDSQIQATNDEEFEDWVTLKTIERKNDKLFSGWNDIDVITDAERIKGEKKNFSRFIRIVSKASQSVCIHNKIEFYGEEILLDERVHDQIDDLKIRLQQEQQQQRQQQQQQQQQQMGELNNYGEGINSKISRIIDESSAPSADDYLGAVCKVTLNITHPDALDPEKHNESIFREEPTEKIRVFHQMIVSHTKNHQKEDVDKYLDKTTEKDTTKKIGFFEYSFERTPLLKGISRTFSTSAGGDEITLTGEGFGDVQVRIGRRRIVVGLVVKEALKCCSE